MSLTLYYAPRSSASPILWILAELDVPHEAIAVDFQAGEQRQPAILAHNPMGQVPTLVDDGQGMFESSAITIHLGQKYGVERGLWPAPGSPEHMVALSWIAWFPVTFGSSIRTVMLNKTEWLPADTRNAKQAAWGLERFGALMKILDERLAKQPYMVGERFTLVDAYGASFMGWGAGEVGFDLATTPHVGAWVGRCMSRAAAQKLQ